METLASCQTRAEIERELEYLPHNLQDTYQGIFERIERETPWLMRLFHYLAVAKEEMSVVAMLQFIAHPKWETGELND